MSKVIVKYDDWSRMGNRMFSYAFGKILALQKNSEFYCDSLPNFQYTWLENKPQTFQLNNPLYLREKYGSNYVNYDELLNYEGDIIIDSYLQKSKYYIPYLGKIRQWFSIGIPTGLKFYLPQKDELIIHIRETDYNDIKKTINHEFYKRNIPLLGYKQNTIVTDDCRTSFIQELKDMGCKVLSSKYVQGFRTSCDDLELIDFLCMLYADHLLIAHSTFSWWASFLGNAEHIYYPDIEGSMWKRNPEKDDIDLFVPNSNYIKIT